MLLAAAMLGTSVPVLAASVYTDSEAGSETQPVDQTHDESEALECDVTAEVASQFTVTIPKKIVLSGSTKKADFEVQVKGDIAGDEAVTVKPDADFYLSSTGKSDVKATVTQKVNRWASKEINLTTPVKQAGSVDASGENGITAGDWSGTFTFSISLDAVPKLAGIEDEGTYPIVDGETYPVLTQLTLKDGETLYIDNMETKVENNIYTFTKAGTFAVKVSNIAGDTTASVTICDHSGTDTTAETADVSMHNIICTVCGAATSTETHGSYSYQSVDADGHSVTCGICGYVVVEKEAHTDNMACDKCGWNSGS
jgi:ribosomal protein S27AE